MKSVFSFRLDGDNEWIIVAERVKCGMKIDHEYRIYSPNSRTFLTKILYLNLGCVIYAWKRFYLGL